MTRLLRKKKKDKKQITKDVARVIKKASDHEQKKSEEKKKRKQSKPKGMMARRMGMVTFWVLFSFMLLVTITSAFSGGSSADNVEQTYERNKLFENEGLEFAKSFVYEYFNWNIDRHGEEDLRARISPYLLNNVDSLGGIRYNNEWLSELDKRNIELKEVQEIDKDKARFVFKIQLRMKSPTDKKDTVIDETKMSYDELMQEKNKVYVKGGYQVKEMTKYINVPVYYDKELDKFAVFELPSFTYIDEGKIESTMHSRMKSLKMLSDNYIENNVNSFLTTFFESYSKDSKDKLSYILEDERHIDGLRGTMKFVGIKDSAIYIIDENYDRFLVDVVVEWQEPTTKYGFDNKYLVVVKRKDQRYVVESLNDEKYVDELIDKYLSQFENEETPLGDFGNVDLGFEEENNDYKYDGERSVDIIEEGVDVVEELDEIEELEDELTDD